MDITDVTRSATDEGTVRFSMDGQEAFAPVDHPLIVAWVEAGGIIADAPETPEPPNVTVLYPVDLWSRLSDAEADAVEQAMTTQSVRIQNIFRSASSYRSDHELWPLLVSMATNLFGSERAAEILAAS